MAGQPKKRAMITELERRTREEFGPLSTETHADYAALWLENGGTLLSLAQSISGALGLQVMYASLNRYLREIDAEWESAVQRARARGSYAMVDEAIGKADQQLDKDDVPAAKLSVDTKLKVAAMFNRSAFGENKGVNVSISLGSQALDAFRRRSVATARVVPELAAPAEDAEVIEIQAVDSEVATL